MLLRLSADQVQRFWNDIRDGLKASMPPLAAQNMSSVNQVMENILLGKMHAWVLYKQTGDAQAPHAEIYALLITQEWVEPGSFTKNLLIYALYGYSFVPEELWQSGLVKLRAYAKSKGCLSIVAFTEVDRVLEIIRQLGGKTNTTFIQLEV